MSLSVQPYEKEYQLVEDIYAVLNSQRTPWGLVKITSEFSYQRGRADIVAINSSYEIIAFEAKLRRWRDGLQQAYRNTCFAHYSYVVLPELSAKHAYRALIEFNRHSVGLCVVSPGCIDILIPSPQHDPIQPWLSEAVISKAR